MQEGFKIVQPLEPDGSRSAAESVLKKRAPSGEVEKKVLAYIGQVKYPISPKQISFEVGLNHDSCKTAVRRLARKSLIMRTPVGYVLPKSGFEEDLEKQILFDGQKHSLPKVHDIHITFKPENLRKALARPELWHRGVHVTYEPVIESPNSDRGPAGSDLAANAGKRSRRRPSMRDRGPASSEFQSPYMRSCTTIARLSKEKHHLERQFDPKDEMGFYRLWRTKGGPYQEIKGGYQEPLDFGTHKIFIQLYRTGTIKVVISNSEHPFDVNQWREALFAIDGLFLSKTGVRFWDISNFFHVEKIHLNNDVVGDLEVSGASKLNCTIKQFDDWLYRVYEKVLGDELVIRTESCLERGNFQDHNLNAMIALLQGNVTPTHVTAALFKTTRDREQDQDDMRRQQNEIHMIGKQVETLKGMFSQLLAKISGGLSDSQPASQKGNGGK